MCTRPRYPCRLGWCDVRTFLNRLKTAVLGAPIATESARPVAMRTRVAVAVFGIGLLSTVAYAPDAVLDALRKGGLTSAMPFVAGGVVLVMLLLGFAYRDNVRHRPDERADYGLVRERLGANAALVTGSALLVDYLFTVAVSVAALAAVRRLHGADDDGSRDGCGSLRGARHDPPGPARRQDASTRARCCGAAVLACNCGAGGRRINQRSRNPVSDPG